MRIRVVHRDELTNGNREGSGDVLLTEYEGSRIPRKGDTFRLLKSEWADPTPRDPLRDPYPGTRNPFFEKGKLKDPEVTLYSVVEVIHGVEVREHPETFAHRHSAQYGIPKDRFRPKDPETIEQTVEVVVSWARSPS